MSCDLHPSGKAALVLLLGAAVSSCTVPSPAVSPEPSAGIEAAIHRSEHGGLVAYYLSEEAAARDKAKSHRGLAAIYRAPVRGTANPALADHCASIARMYEEIAVEYRGMADLHRLLEREPALSKP